MPVEMICPHSGEAFTPEFINSPSGAIVAAPEQTSPTDPSKKMVSAYGVAAGIVNPTEQMPLARNSSGKFDLGRNFANKLWNATRFALKRTDHSLLIEEPIDITLDHLQISGSSLVWHRLFQDSNRLWKTTNLMYTPTPFMISSGMMSVTGISK